MFKKIVLWCEFPEKVDWKKADGMLKKLDLKVDAYVASSSKEEFMKWKKKGSEYIKICAWPALPKNEGYWFSGFTKKSSIDILNEFSGTNSKIDLEPPIPTFDYSTPRIIFYIIKFFFRKGENSPYLENTIRKLKGKIIINEFPLPKFILKRWGCHAKLEKNMTRNFMAYTSLTIFFRPILRMYLKSYLKNELEKNPDIMCSVGLVGPGILKTERPYSSIKQFEYDLVMAKKLGIKSIAVYSLESILSKENPEEWLTLLK